MSSRASHPTKIFSFIRIPPRFAKEYAKFIPKSSLQEEWNKVTISKGNSLIYADFYAVFPPFSNLAASMRQTFTACNVSDEIT
jgi:hypothetical protein